MFSPSPYFLKKDLIYLFYRKGKGERKKEGEKHCSAASCTCLDWGPNPLPRHVPDEESNQ